MCKTKTASRSRRAFYSLDAALALAIALLVFASFSSILSRNSSRLQSQARQESGELLALRLSSYILDSAAASGNEGAPGGYFSANELYIARLRAGGLQEILQKTGAGYASVSLVGSSGEIFSSSLGERGAEVFCAGRLALSSGEIVRLEACVS